MGHADEGSSRIVAATLARHGDEPITPPAQAGDAFELRKVAGAVHGYGLDSVSRVLGSARRVAAFASMTHDSEVGSPKSQNSFRPAVRR